MLWPILFVVTFLLFFVILKWRPDCRKDEKIDHSDYLGGSAIGSIVIFLLGMFFAVFIGLFLPQEWKEEEIINLVSLRDKDGANGSFFLGSGGVGTTDYYFFYKKVGEGFQQGKVAVGENVTIFENKSQDKVLKVQRYWLVNPSHLWIALPVPHEKKYDFFIPEGSLKRNFVLQ